MKKSTLALSLVIALGASPNVYADGWLDTVKGWFGMSTESTDKAATEAEDAASEASAFGIEQLVSLLTTNLGVTESQAEGGLASIIDYAKKNLSSTDFSQLTDSLPGVNDILSSVPDVSEQGEQAKDGLSSLMNKAAEYSDSVKNINELKQQFDELGLSPEMISGFVSQINTYLNSEEGQEAKALLQSSLAKLSF